MLDAERFGDQPVLEVHDIAIVVIGETGFQAITRLARLPMPYAIGKDQVVAARVKRTPGPSSRRVVTVAR
jgi:hypothetical protein